MKRISEHLFVHTDTCNVYLIKAGTNAVLIDFGDGTVLDHLAEAGVSTITDVLLTHHHRDQLQGLSRLAGSATRIHVPETERALVDQAERHWLGRMIYNNYMNTTDRFTPLESQTVHASLLDYDRFELNGINFEVVPTPGHTLGSSSILATIDGKRVLFTGDFIYGDGRLWSLADTQWGYNDPNGLYCTLFSLDDVRALNPDLLLPSHGPAIENPAAAMKRLEERVWDLLRVREQEGPFAEMIRDPLHEITPHLLHLWPSQAHTYALLSKSKKALVIDAGYQMLIQSSGWERHSKRPLDRLSRPLREKYGIETIDVVMPTHYHDDHVSGMPIFRRRHGAQVWAAESFSDILRRPAHYDLPCLWFDPIPVDRDLPIGQPFQWEEYTFRLTPIPGHTLYAVMIEFEVDGKRVLAIGDQHGNDYAIWNYVYKNRFRHHDYVDSGNRYKEIRPDIIISGHWPPHHIEEGYLDELAKRGELLKSAHEALLPFADIDLGAEHQAAFIRPYQSWIAPGESQTFGVEARNPLHEESIIRLQPVVPDGWSVAPSVIEQSCAPGHWFTASFTVTPTPALRHRARIAVDMTAGSRRMGQIAEALVSVGFEPGPL